MHLQSLILVAGCALLGGTPCQQQTTFASKNAILQEMVQDAREARTIVERIEQRGLLRKTDMIRDIIPTQHMEEN